MKYIFQVYAYGCEYEPVKFATKKEALSCAAGWVKDCRDNARHKLTQVGSFKRLDNVELRIGGRQGFHVWSTATINREETR